MEKIRLSAEARRSQILEQASHLFSIKGYYGVTTKELSVNCGITEPILYRHFSNKEHLYQEVKKFHQGRFDEIEMIAKRLSPSSENFIFMTRACPHLPTFIHMREHAINTIDLKFRANFSKRVAILR